MRVLLDLELYRLDGTGSDAPHQAVFQSLRCLTSHPDEGVNPSRVSDRDSSIRAEKARRPDRAYPKYRTRLRDARHKVPTLHDSRIVPWWEALRRNKPLYRHACVLFRHDQKQTTAKPDGTRPRHQCGSREYLQDGTRYLSCDGQSRQRFVRWYCRTDNLYLSRSHR